MADALRSDRGLGILPFGLGGIFSLQAIRNAGAGKATVLTSCGSPFGLHLLLILLKERMTVRITAGTVLVISGVGFII
ncbi:MAG: EamA family transporter [Thermodesulfobacteriota bacterium]|jgi:drug/metabolite transporter (DMT)-like permease